jgi:hypothetical protein
VLFSALCVVGDGPRGLDNNVNRKRVDSQNNNDLFDIEAKSCASRSPSYTEAPSCYANKATYEQMNKITNNNALCI